jgi:hypothetical protein
MNNHILRHGLMTKKDGDDRPYRRFLSFRKETPRPRSPYDWNRTVIYHKLPQTGCCDFNHAPYNSKLDLLDPKTSDKVGFAIWTMANHVRAAAELCEFCRILWLGLQKNRHYWEAKNGDYSYCDHRVEHMDDTDAQYYAQMHSREALEDFLVPHPVDLDKIIFRLSSKEDDKSLEVRLLLEPRENSSYAWRREWMVLDYHTVEGMAFRTMNK